MAPPPPWSSAPASCTTGIAELGMARLAPLFGVGVCGSRRWIWLIACLVWRGLCYLRGHSSWRELKADNPCGLCCLESWVLVTTMGTLLLTCLYWSEGFETQGDRRDNISWSPSDTEEGEDNSFSISSFLVQNSPCLFKSFFPSILLYSVTWDFIGKEVPNSALASWRSRTHGTHCTTGTYHWPWPLSPLALHCMCVLTWTWYWEVSCIMTLELEYFFLCSVRNKRTSIGCFSLDLRITTPESFSQSLSFPARAPWALPAGVSPE